MMKKFAAVAALSFLLTGCLSSVPVQHHYLLTTPQVSSVKKPLFQAPLAISAVSSLPQWSGTGFMYRLGTYEYQADYYHRFLLSPQDMLGEIIEQGLQNSGLFPKVASSFSLLDVAHSTLKTSLVALYADYSDSAHPRAVMEVDVDFYEYQQDHESLKFSKKFREDLPLADKSTDALIAAWQTEINDILEKLLQALKAVH